MTPMLPYYHPTTCLVVDDDKLFLESLSHRYGQELLCVTEANPKLADRALHSQASAKLVQRQLIGNTSANPGEGHTETGEDELLRRASAIANIPHHLERFSLVSVVIVDYAMPAMNGLDFCRSISDLSLKKILLTGKAGDTLAVSAFNEGLIDLFLVKQDPQLSAKLPLEVQRLQRSYFKQRAAASPVSMTDEAGFLGEPAAVHSVEEIIEEVGAVEHYLLQSPPGLLLVDADGKTTAVYIFDTERMRAQLEIAILEQAPAALIRKLEQGRTLLVCPSDSGYYERRFAPDWKQFVFECEPLDKCQPWHIAVNRSPGIDLKASSLHRYRQIRRPM